jgi:DNA-binding MarR family transcriptional regulator
MTTPGAPNLPNAAAPPLDLASDPTYGVVQPLSVILRWARHRVYEKMAQRSNVKLDRSAINILGVLKRQGPMRTSDLADILGLDRSTVSRQVASAVSLGFVARDGDVRDARAAMLSLTEEGLAKQRKLNHAWSTIAMELVADWSEADQREIARLLDKLSRRIEDDIRS